MDPNNFQLDKREEFSDGKYSVHTFLDQDKKFRRLSCDSESICILPFELNESNQIKNVYLLKYDDYLLGGSKFTCVTDTFNKDKYDSHFLAVEDCLNEKMEISNIDINDCYFLGTVSHGLPFSKEYRCYAVNITSDISKPGSSSFFSDIEKIRFNRVINGNFPDSLILSCSLLLLSYFSE
jgi:hypothetical protein